MERSCYKISNCVDQTNSLVTISQSSLHLLSLWCSFFTWCFDFPFLSSLCVLDLATGDLERCLSRSLECDLEPILLRLLFLVIQIFIADLEFALFLFKQVDFLISLLIPSQSEYLLGILKKDCFDFETKKHFVFIYSELSDSVTSAACSLHGTKLHGYRLCGLNRI